MTTAGWLFSLLMAAGPANASLPPIFGPHETILFQGDSITDGNRGRTADPNHILGHGYAFLVASDYGAAYPALDLNFVNRGISGNRLQDLATRWEQDTVAIRPDVLSILIGINDVLAAMREKRTFAADDVYQVYDRLLTQTVERLPHVKLVLCEPFILNVGMVAKDSAIWHRSLADLDAAIERLGAKYKAPVVHFQRLFDEATRRAPAEHWIWDGIHPTYSGHRLMADEWVRAYNEFYVSPLLDAHRNSAIAPQVNFERDSYDWLHRHADVMDAQKSANPDVVMIGDSITHFWGGTPPSNHVNGPQSWKATFDGVKVLNMGFGWDRTQNVLWRLQHGEFVGLKPKSIILNIGTNNLVGDATARTNTPAETAVGIEAIVSVLRERSPNSHIFLMAVFPRGFEKGNPLDQSITELNGILAKSFAGMPSVTMLDIGAALRNPDGSISPHILSDGTHPTDRGYAIWGQALRAAGAIPHE